MKKIFVLTALYAMVILMSLQSAYAQTDSGQKQFAKTKVGEVEIITLVDNSSEFDISIFDGDKTLREQLSSGKKLPASINAFLVKKGDSLILVDTGIGKQLLENIKAAGFQPEQINAIILTHTHGDHTGGLLQNSQAAFPNATLWLSQKELAYWQSQNLRYADLCKKMYNGLKFIVQDEKTPLIIPEMTAIAIEGHTPGHTALLIRSQNEGAILIGDLLHSVTLQFAYPDICANFDADKPKAIAARKKLLKLAADEKLLIAGAHIPFPAFGKVKIQGDGFQFAPAPLKNP
ncbi:MAG: MBL fold metallo-hydrolase [Planctomycetaceae bacterium]|jgi:glyoxylase-like metal-dependent hydrolase (beta-lactamase superfamily II)|nr:MBL fold metallo-hydrolase [Planctomycetaceae bacterium]